MCLGIPGKVITVDGAEATVDFFGVRRKVRLDVVDEPVGPGDYILSHVGFAIRRIPEEEIGETLALFEELLRAEAAHGPMETEVQDEMAATKEEPK